MRVISSSKVNISLFVIAAILLLVSVVGGTQAALTYYSDTYLARLAVSDIGVTLLENGKEVAWRNYEGNDSWSTAKTKEDTRLLQNLLSDGERFQIGRSYKEELQAMNSGEIDQYVRIKLYKYWEDADGNKVTTVSPDLITIEFAKDSGWQIDEDSITDERIVAYYSLPLASGEMTPLLTKSFSVAPEVTRMVTESKTVAQQGNKIVTTYDYNGLRFCLEAEVDAVQQHNITSAALSAWGQQVTEANGNLSVG